MAHIPPQSDDAQSQTGEKWRRNAGFATPYKPVCTINYLLHFVLLRRRVIKFTHVKRSPLNTLNSFSQFKPQVEHCFASLGVQDSFAGKLMRN